jgi:hypothetical protein
MNRVTIPSVPCRVRHVATSTASNASAGITTHAISLHRALPLVVAGDARPDTTARIRTSWLIAHTTAAIQKSARRALRAGGIGDTE